MKSPLEILSRLVRSRPKPGPEEIRDQLRSRTRSFRALLTANTNALEIMAEMEDALHAGGPFGMAFVRGQCTAAGVAVFKMVQGLLELSGGRYRDLPERFRAVTGKIDAILSRHPDPGGGALVLGMDEIDRRRVDQVGEKLANLGEVRNRIGLPVPDGFAVTAAASRRFLEAGHLQDEINRRLKTLDVDDLEALYATSAAVQKLIASAPLPADLETAIGEQFGRLSRRTGREPLVSVRSSALGEGGGRASFAGQYRTHLDVDGARLAAAYREIVAGKYRSQAIAYREQRGYRHQDALMAVGCLAMVDAAASGVAWSRPWEQPRSPWVVVYAAPGPGKGIVDGSAPHEMLRVSRDSLQPVVLRDESAFGTPCVKDADAREIARMADRIERHFGAPQEIEWAIDREGRAFVLQARPLRATGVEAEAEPALRPDPGGGPAPLLAGGVTASRGAGSGAVFRVASEADAVRFPRGAVLSVAIPDPEWAVLLGRAAAVLATSGQAATHLATVARELAVPAIFGMAGLDSIGDGTLVTVDATARRVYPGRVEALLGSAPPRPNLMEGSPIQKLLGDAMSLVTPLHLTQPDSPFFRVSSCRSLHDITRFCHEKAIAEMFGFGGRHGFSRDAAKRLVVGDVPSQWWVIDLEDGFREGLDPASQFVRVEDVVSEPMLAIWKGMTAIPWAGPPPVSLRGLGAIIAQSAMNPALDPAVRSSLSGRNYFLVSRSFCNLSVRLGYHFALAEASFSELLAESYVHFQFKGGAADERRRGRRARLLADTLREMEFRVELKGDALSARIERRPVPFLRERLVILGYLLIHTRQIDMAMDDAAFVDGYLEKIRADIRTIRGGLGADA